MLDNKNVFAAEQWPQHCVNVLPRTGWAGIGLAGEKLITIQQKVEIEAILPIQPLNKSGNYRPTFTMIMRIPVLPEDVYSLELRLPQSSDDGTGCRAIVENEQIPMAHQISMVTNPRIQQNRLVLLHHHASDPHATKTSH